jgi:hypothetical protein
VASFFVPGVRILRDLRKVSGVGVMRAEFARITDIVSAGAADAHPP